MLSEFFGFEYGVIIKDDFIDLDGSYKEQLDLLYEDMFQLSYNYDQIVLDIGWYEGLNGFKIYIIKHQDWEKPFYQKVVISFPELKDEIQKAINIFNKEICN